MAAIIARASDQEAQAKANSPDKIARLHMAAIIESLMDQSFWVHFVLIGGDVLATVAVGWGIIWEAPEQPASRHVIAKKLVIWGILAETLCSICLFAFDETISHSQQTEIIALVGNVTAVKKTANDATDAADRLKLLNQGLQAEIDKEKKSISDADDKISKLGGRENSLDKALGTGEGRIASAEQNQREFAANQRELAGNLAGTKKEAEDWLSAVTPRRIDGAISNLSKVPAPPIFVVAERGSDTELLADDLVTAMKEGGLDAEPLKSDKDSMVEGVSIEYGYSTNEGAREDAIRVVADSVCKQISLQDVFAKVSPVHAPFKGPSEVWDKRVPVDAILILVGRNPSQFLFNKKYRKWGGPPLQSYSEMAPSDIPAAKWYCGNE
jgi:hypothetical protein